jgi:hypothetical protein
MKDLSSMAFYNVNDATPERQSMKRRRLHAQEHDTSSPHMGKVDFTVDDHEQITPSKRGRRGSLNAWKRQLKTSGIGMPHSLYISHIFRT